MLKRRSGSTVWFALSLVFALGAAFVTNAFIKSLAAGVPVVVATRAVDPMEPVPADALAVQTRPKASLPPDAIQSVSDAVGKFTRTGLVPGMVLQRSMLAGDVSEGLTGLDARLADLAGKENRPLRAFPLKLTEAQGYNLVRVGHRVDIVVYVKGIGGGVLVAGAPVLAKIDKAQDQGTIGAPGSGQQASRPAPEGVVVLALAPQDAVRVAMAAQMGSVTLALRPAGQEQGPGEAPQLGEDALFSAPQAPRPQQQGVTGP